MNRRNLKSMKLPFLPEMRENSGWVSWPSCGLEKEELEMNPRHFKFSGEQSREERKSEKPRQKSEKPR